MRVLYIALVEFDVPGGPTIHVENLIKGFKAIGMDIKLMCPRPMRKTKILCEYNFRLIPFFGYSPLRLFLFNLISAYYIFVEIVKYKPHALYVRDRPGNIVAWFFSKLFNIPFFIEMNGVVKDDFPQLSRKEKKESFQQHFFRYYRKKQFDQARGLIFNCHSLQQTYKQKCTLNAISTIIPMHVDTEQFKILSKRECRQKLNLDLSSFIIGYVGSFAPNHDIDILIRVIKELIILHINAELLLVGPNNRNDEIKRLQDGCLWNRIHVTGWVDHSMVPIYINAMDIGTSFFKDASGNTAPASLKIKEYLACGTPVLFNCNNIPDLELLKSLRSGTRRFPYEKSSSIPIGVVLKTILKFRRYNHVDRNMFYTTTHSKYSLKMAAQKTSDFIRANV